MLLVLEVEGVRVLARSGDWKLDLMHAYPYVDHTHRRQVMVLFMIGIGSWNSERQDLAYLQSYLESTTLVLRSTAYEQYHSCGSLGPSLLLSAIFPALPHVLKRSVSVDVTDSLHTKSQGEDGTTSPQGPNATNLPHCLSRVSAPASESTTMTSDLFCWAALWKGVIP